MINVSIEDILKTTNWISSEDGTKVYDVIHQHLKAGEEVALSFKGGVFIVTPFLNAAIGRLYSGEFSEGDLTSRLKYVDCDEFASDKITRVVANAKAYYADPALHDSVNEGVS